MVENKINVFSYKWRFVTTNSPSGEFHRWISILEIYNMNFCLTDYGNLCQLDYEYIKLLQFA